MCGLMGRSIPLHSTPGPLLLITEECTEAAAGGAHKQLYIIVHTRPTPPAHLGHVPHGEEVGSALPTLPPLQRGVQAGTGVDVSPYSF